MDEHAFQARAEELRLAARAEVADEVRAIRAQAKTRMLAVQANNELELAAARGQSMRKSRVPIVLLALASIGGMAAAGLMYHTPELHPTEASVRPTWTGGFSAGIVLTGALAERQLAQADTETSKPTRHTTRSASTSRAPCTGDAFDPLNDCLR